MLFVRHKVITNYWFENFIYICIFANICTMAAVDFDAQANNLPSQRNEVLATWELSHHIA